MSAGRAEVLAVKQARDEQSLAAAGRGHALQWELGENARRRGHAYFWLGRCEHCGAELSVGSGWSTCSGVRDARVVTCSGPGTAVLTALETVHVGDQVAAAVATFGTEVAEASGAGRAEWN